MMKLLQHQTRRFENLHKGLVRWYEGSFHVSFLKQYHEDKDDPIQSKSKRAHTAITTSHEREVEEILIHRVIPQRGMHVSYVEYFVRWKGLPESKASWEHDLTLWNEWDKIRAYEQGTTRPSWT